MHARKNVQGRHRISARHSFALLTMRTFRASMVAALVAAVMFIAECLRTGRFWTTTFAFVIAIVLYRTYRRFTRRIKTYWDRVVDVYRPTRKQFIAFAKRAKNQPYLYWEGTRCLHHALVPHASAVA